MTVKEIKPREGDYMETFTGKKFYPIDPRLDDIYIEDIAHALSNICRFNGHCKFFYSVAQHCVICHDYASKQFYGDVPLHCLMHDAAEAYACDIPRPLKKYIDGYKPIENQIQEQILFKFGLWPVDPYIHTNVKAIDDIVLHQEAKVLLNQTGWSQDELINQITIEQWTPDRAEAMFLELKRSRYIEVYVGKVRE